LVLCLWACPGWFTSGLDEVWMRAKQIHTVTGAKNMAHTLQRAHPDFVAVFSHGLAGFWERSCEFRSPPLASPWYV